jgi:hypothetical protein
MFRKNFTQLERIFAAVIQKDMKIIFSHFKMKFSLAISRVKWLNGGGGGGTNVSKTISVHGLRVLIWLSI